MAFIVSKKISVLKLLAYLARQMAQHYDCLESHMSNTKVCIPLSCSSALACVCSIVIYSTKNQHKIFFIFTTMLLFCNCVHNVQINWNSRTSLLKCVSVQYNLIITVASCCNYIAQCCTRHPSMSDPLPPETPTKPVCSGRAPWSVVPWSVIVGRWGIQEVFEYWSGYTVMT